MSEATNEFASVQELACRWQVEERTVQKWIKCGILPAVRLGERVLRVSWADVQAFERRQRIGNTN